MIGLIRLLLTPPHGDAVRRVDCDDPAQALLIAAWYRLRGWTVEEQEL